MDDLELVPDGPFSRAMAAEDARAEEAAYRQLDEMGDVPDDHEASQWVSFLRDLADPDLGSETVDNEDAQEVEGMGWIEDTHGRAAFVPRCLADLDDDEDVL